ncbi:MAG: ABC transporter permease subunit [Clostridiales bacterium]|nr:ABC transporter permease subunit [Clostridiales bacterium]
MLKKEKEIKAIFIFIAVLFFMFLALPVFFVLIRSFQTDSGAVGFAQYVKMFSSKGFMTALWHSFAVAGTSDLVTVILAFILAYTVNNTDIHPKLKSAISVLTVFPMLLPTITYGFAIIYSFGKEGLITKLLGFAPFEIYGFKGLVMGYVIYTLPIAFLLINNTFQYIDKRFVIVSRIMGDSKLDTFLIACVRPMIGTLSAAFIQSFFLSFTDYGIPAAIGGEFNVIATTLYNEMLGSVPNFSNGAVVAIVMLVPSALSILLLNYLERFNFRYNKTTETEFEKNIFRDIVLGTLSVIILICVLSVFLVIVIIPFVEMWPYKLQFSLSHIISLFTDSSMLNIYINSITAAVLTAIFGTLIAYGAALVTSRSKISNKCKQVIESIALVINAIPGMVLGIAFMFAFSGTPLRNSMFLIVMCNIIHFFSTPYLMMKNSLSKMNESWETTAMLMGDSWVKTIIRVVTPNAEYTILEVLSYYFVNTMVTISAIIFIVGAHTMVITTKIKELQHYAKFDDIFALSLLLLATNLAVKGIFALLSKRKKEN